ncbi:hypothetical protein D3C80_1887600 [compost metagenome]
MQAIGRIARVAAFVDQAHQVGGRPAIGRVDVGPTTPDGEVLEPEQEGEPGEWQQAQLEQQAGQRMLRQHGCFPLSAAAGAPAPATGRCPDAP